MEKKSRARVLLKSVRYPTYQFPAIASSGKETPENQLMICVLSVMEWLRTKFQEFDIPEAFQTPPPEDYRSIKLAELKNAYIDAGYTVETVCLPNDKIWAFRLLEPDLSTKWENGEEISNAVPGRIFETNIAFKVSGKTLHCGISVIVSEPENTDASKRALVLRPAVIQKLADNPKIGLRSGYLLAEQLWELNSRERIKQLKDYLNTGVLPAVVFCDCVENAGAALADKLSEITKPGFPTRKPMPDLSQLLERPVRPDLQGNLPTPVKTQFEPAVGLPYDTDLFKRARMGYVHSFHLPADQFSAFAKIHQIEVNSGDILFQETKELGGELFRYSYSKETTQTVFDDLMTKSRDYLRQKPVSFAQVSFLTDAKRLMVEYHARAHLNAQDTAKMYEEKINLLRQEHKNTLMDKDDQIVSRDEKIARQKALLEEMSAQIRAVNDAADERIGKIQRELALAQRKMEYYKSLLSRPKTPQEIPAWIEARFSDRLELHPRAVRMIQAVPVQEINMTLICNAIEYLAMEYRDVKSGNITWEDANQLCTEKYDHPFTVTGSGDTAIEMYSTQYKVKYKYKPNFKGKPSEVALNEHLKIGNTPPNMVRIYFFYDDTRKMIIVGSLPKHLPVAQIQA